MALPGPNTIMCLWAVSIASIPLLFQYSKSPVSDAGGLPPAASRTEIRTSAQSQLENIGSAHLFLGTFVGLIALLLLACLTRRYSRNKPPGADEALDLVVLRAGFLRKVYGILTFQVLVTLGIAATCMFTPAIRDTFVHITVYWQIGRYFCVVLFIPTSVSLGALGSPSVKSRYPVNYILLGIFTISMAVNIGYVCSLYHYTGHGALILQAFGATCAIFLGLTLYTLLSGKDFSYLNGFLAVTLWGLLFAGVVGLWFPWMRNSLIHGFVGAVVFSGYVLYDTWRLQSKFGYDDYIIATIELYLDIVNLFLYILKILSALKKGEKKNAD